ncbi:MAG: right-handed parallel beta-helix repeat-containing protein [Wenzhouxiangellaceae bacterium]
MTRWITAFALLTACTLSHADGVIEINQACVPTGCFDGDSTGFPVRISETGSYRLTSNLDTRPDTVTAIDIEADRVTLDLNGFSVIGPQTCSYDSNASDVICDLPTPFAHRLIIVEGANNTLRNGTVKGAFSNGVELRGPGPHVVENIHVTENGSRGLTVRQELDSSPAVIVRNSTASVNEGEGFQGIDGLVRFDGNLALRNGNRGIISGICSNNTSVENGTNYQSCTDLGGNAP